MPFAATPRDYLSEEIQKERQTPYNITYMWNLIYHTNELIYKTDSQTLRLVVAKDKGMWKSDRLGVWGSVDANHYIQNG